MLVMAEKRMSKAAQKRNERYNNSHKLHNFEVGDYVIAQACNFSQKSEKIMRKLLALFEGPYVIEKRVGPSTFILCHTEQPIERGIYNSTELKLYVSRSTEDR